MKRKNDRLTPKAADYEHPPWIEEALDPTFRALAFGSYGDGYLEWVRARYVAEALEESAA